MKKIFMLVFVYIILVYVLYAGIEAITYEEVGKENQEAWHRLSLSTSTYHILVWYVFMPIITLFPAIMFYAMKKNIKTTFRLLLFSVGVYFLSVVLEDYLFFVFSSREFYTATWFTWINLGFMKVPDFYIFDLILALILILISVFGKKIFKFKRLNIII